MSWTTLQLPSAPAPVTAGLQGIATALSAAGTAASTLKTLLEAVAAVVPPSTSAAQMATAAALAALKASVSGLLNDTGVYVLLVPPRARVIMPAEAAAILGATPVPNGTADALNTTTSSAAGAALLQASRGASGGNAGFVRTVLESLDDLGDVNRPVLPATAAVSGVYLVAGAASFASLLPFTNGLSAVLAPGAPTSVDPPGLPVPQELSARLTSDGVRLQWRLPETPVDLPTLDTTARIVEVAVIRGTSVSLLSATTATELFNTSSLSVGLEAPGGTDASPAPKVLATLDPGTAYYVDTDALDAGRAYYYVIAYRLALGAAADTAAGKGTDLGYTRFSNCVKVVTRSGSLPLPRTGTGVPPDWRRTPRTVDLFPALGGALDSLVASIDSMAATTQGYGDFLKSVVAALQLQLQLFQRKSADLQRLSASLSALSALNAGGASMRTFSGTGGTAFLRSDLVAAFSDSSDPGRPAFDNNEFVAGAVILATTPAASALLSVLFGTAASALSPVQAALSKIDAELGSLAVDADARLSSVAVASDVAVGEDTGFCYHSYESPGDLTGL